MKTSTILPIIVIVIISLSVATFALINQAAPTSNLTNPTITPTLAPIPTIALTPTPAPTIFETQQPTVNPTESTPTISPTENPTPKPVATPTPTPIPSPTTGLEPVEGVPSFTLTAGCSGYGTSNFATWVVVTITPITQSNVNAYRVEYKRQVGDTNWFYLVVPQSTSNISVQTSNLLENTVYDFRVAAVNQVGDNGPYSAIQNIAAAANTVAYPIPTEVYAMGILKGVNIEWHNLFVDGYNVVSYNVYRSTGKDFTKAELVKNVVSSWYDWKINDIMADYVPQNFWVTTVSPSGIESQPSKMVTATPIEGIDEPPTQTPAFNLTNKSNEDAVFFETWVQISIGREEKVATENGECRVSGYAFQYKLHSDKDNLSYETYRILQPSSGNAIGKTWYLKEDTEYDFRACFVNNAGVLGQWSDVITFRSQANTFVPPVITGLESTGTLNGVLLSWDSVGLSNDAFYRIYESKNDMPSTAVLVAQVPMAAPASLWGVKDFNNDFVQHYFWVVIVNSGGVEGPMGNSVSAIPKKGIEGIPSEAYTFTMTTQSNGSGTDSRMCVKTAIVCLDDLIDKTEQSHYITISQ